MKILRYRAKLIPYYAIGATFLIICVCVGGLIVAGTEYIQEEARREGQFSIMSDLPISALIHINIKDNVVNHDL